MTWAQIFQIGGLAGVISAVLGFALKELSAWFDRQRQAKFLALRVAISLETHLQTCVIQLYDINAYISSRGSAGSNGTGLPEYTPPSADGGTWLNLKPALSDEVLSLPNHISNENKGISWHNEFDHNPYNTLNPLYELLFKLLQMSKDARSSYGFEPRPETIRTEKYLKEDHDNYRQRLEKKEAREKAAETL